MTPIETPSSADAISLRTIEGTDDTGRRWTAYTASEGAWLAVAEQTSPGSPWWRIWLVPPEKGQPRRALWEWCQWSGGYARGVAEHIARAFAVVEEALSAAAEEGT